MYVLYVLLQYELWPLELVEDTQRKHQIHRLAECDHYLQLIDRNHATKSDPKMHLSYCNSMKDSGGGSANILLC